MKKFFAIVATVFVVAGFNSCSNDIEGEVVENATQPIKLDITVANLGDDATRAVKTGWVTGDKLNIWFDGDTYTNRAKADLVLTYNGSSWEAGTLNNGVTLNANGTMTVLYEGYNDWENMYTHSDHDNYPVTSCLINSYSYATPILYTSSSPISYTYSGSTLTANINSWESITKLQVVVSGINASNASDYALSINGVNNIGSVFIYDAGSITFSSNTKGGYTLGIANADGVAFYFARCTKFNTSSDYTFTLYKKSDGSTRTFSVTGKTITVGNSSMANIKIPVRKFAGNHECVDLGLSVKWATMNVGATAPERSGDFFAWGATEPTRSAGYYWNNTPYQTANTTLDYETRWTKYLGSTTSSYKDASATDIDALKTVLDPDDDAATVNWGGSWRMPTKAEQDELRNNCTWTWTRQNGVNGYNVTGTNGNSIFLPAAGNYYDNIHMNNDYGHYWSSTLYKTAPCRAYNLDLGTSYLDWNYSYRRYGYSVRAVCP